MKIGDMQLPVIKIGNSKGILLSKNLLEKYNIEDAVEVIPEDGQIVIRPIVRPRKGWKKAFKKMAENRDDRLLVDDVFDDENFDEWNEK